MATKSFVEATAEAVADRTATAGQKIGRFAGWSAVATVSVHALTTYREYTVLLALRALARIFVSKDGGDPAYVATVILFIAQTYDHTWSYIIGGGK